MLFTQILAISSHLQTKFWPQKLFFTPESDIEILETAKEILQYLPKFSGIQIKHPKVLLTDISLTEDVMADISDDEDVSEVDYMTNDNERGSIWISTPKRNVLKNGEANKSKQTRFGLTSKIQTANGMRIPVHVLN